MDNIKLDKTINTPLYQQLGDAIFNLIETGSLSTNEKLPPIRTLAKSLGINNTTVVSAYKYLESKKAVYSQTGSGTFVSPIPLENIPEPSFKEELDHLTQKPTFDKNMINFTSTSLPPTLFPTSQFKNAFEVLLDRDGAVAFANMDSQGYLPLREILCTYLKHYNITSAPENIQILSGAQQGLDIVSKAMISYGDIVFVEKPTFYGAIGSFLNRGCQIVEIPMEKDGMDIIALENLVKLYRPKFLYVMAYFQTPTGISYSAIKKKKILDMAEKYNFYIIEDDNLYDFNYKNEKLVPLKAMDYKNRVIYLKSFSKILMPGLRIGFAVLPKKIMSRMMAAKYTTDISTSGFLQKALDIYFRENKWKDHIETIKTYGMDKYKLTIKYLDRYLPPNITYHKSNGGISLWINIDKIDSHELINKALEKNVILSPGSQFYISNNSENYLRLSFINLSDEKIEAGIRRLGECLKH